MMMHLWLAPDSSLLVYVTFSYSTGILAWSVTIFRLSLVPHDYDKVRLPPSCQHLNMRPLRSLVLERCARFDLT